MRLKAHIVYWLIGLIVTFFFGENFLIPVHAEELSGLQHISPKSATTYVIVIDPGHGGENEGTKENGFLEKSMTMVTAQAMYDELVQYDNVDVYLTHTDDIDMSLKERAQYAAQVNADFLFSIHYNASVDHDLFGSEVWISATPPYNAYGYQFGYQQMLTMKDMGLFLRGVKTKLNERNTDYYGIIRECTALEIPSVIIEHCHVDEERDYPFCDTTEKQAAFGKADALSVAKFLGLKSSVLDVDYSTSSDYPSVSAEKVVQSTLWDETEPDVVQIEEVSTDYDTGEIQVKVTGADYDSPLIYYDYSCDGGMTYSALQSWPGSDVLNNSYNDTFTTTIQVPIGITPTIIFRAYNEFDNFTESNPIVYNQIFLYGPAYEDTTESSQSTGETGSGKENFGTESDAALKTISSNSSKATSVSFFQFLMLCLIFVIILFFVLLIYKYLLYRRRLKKQRRKKQGRKYSANDSEQKRSGRY